MPALGTHTGACPSRQSCTAGRGSCTAWILYGKAGTAGQHGSYIAKILYGMAKPQGAPWNGAQVGRDRQQGV